MAKKRSIHDFWPFPTYRRGQKEILDAVEEFKKEFQVLLIVAPVASGKESIMYTIANYFGDSCATVPTNTLLRQLEKNHEVLTLYGADHYKGGKEEQKVVKTKLRRGIPVFCNPYTFIAHRLFRKTLLFDEGHRLVQLNRDLQKTGILQKDLDYDINIRTIEELKEHVDFRIRNTEGPKKKKLTKLLDKIKSGDYYIERVYDRKGDKINLVPNTPQLHSVFDNKYIERIILMSATISEDDLLDMGLDRNVQVLKLEIPSQIPIEQRPLQKLYVGNVNFQNQEELSKDMAAKLIQIANHHQSEGPGKGFVHTTYEMAKYLQRHLKSDKRFIFHSKLSQMRQRQFNDWLESPASEGKIFVGCGFDEGISLKGPDFVWQAITKISFLSLGDDFVKRKSEENPRWYIYQALKVLIQQYGRICRGEDDFGITYLLDGSVERVMEFSIENGLVPNFFLDVWNDCSTDNS